MEGDPRDRQGQGAQIIIRQQSACAGAAVRASRRLWLKNPLRDCQSGCVNSGAPFGAGQQLLQLPLVLYGEQLSGRRPSGDFLRLRARCVCERRL